MHHILSGVRAGKTQPVPRSMSGAGWDGHAATHYALGSVATYNDTC